jgi:PelA/Pel-15E family pectate lyase
MNQLDHALNPEAVPVTVERCQALLPDPTEWMDYLGRSKAGRRRDVAALVAELQDLGQTAATRPPEGNFAGSIPLDRTPEWYGTAEALALADAVVSFQTPSGGWSKNLDFSKHSRRLGEHFSLNSFSLERCREEGGEWVSQCWHFVGTFDNNATTAQIRFLGRVLLAHPGPGAARWSEAANRGLDFILASQFPNGGWPQVWPLDGGYHDALAFNDEAIANNLSLLWDVTTDQDGFRWVPDARRQACRSALALGLSCVVRTQLSERGTKTGWCQQYDPVTLEPSSGRSYEMNALASSESARLADVLMRLPDPSAEVAAAVDSAVSWLGQVAIHGHEFSNRSGRGRELLPCPGGGPIWARFYDLDTRRPLFADRDRKIRWDVTEVSRERRDGYLWFTKTPRATLKNYAQWRRGREARA